MRKPFVMLAIALLLCAIASEIASKVYWSGIILDRAENLGDQRLALPAQNLSWGRIAEWTPVLLLSAGAAAGVIAAIRKEKGPWVVMAMLIVIFVLLWAVCV
jgi:hypothetical protein